MPEPSENSPSFAPLEVIGNVLKRQLFFLQDYSLLTFRSLANLFTPPQYWGDTIEQMDQIGVGSLPIVVIASFFIGGVLVLNTASQFQRFGEKALRAMRWLWRWCASWARRSPRC